MNTYKRGEIIKTESSPIFLPKLTFCLEYATRGKEANI